MINHLTGGPPVLHEGAARGARGGREGGARWRRLQRARSASSPNLLTKPDWPPGPGKINFAGTLERPLLGWAGWATVFPSANFLVFVNEFSAPRYVHLCDGTG